MLRSLIPAFLIAAITAGWLFWGFYSGVKPEVTKPAATLDAPATLQAVSTAEIGLRDFSSELRFTAETQVDRKLEIKAEIGGQIASLRVERGQSVSKDQVIAVLEADERPAQRAEAQAALSQAEADLKAKKALLNQGYGSQIEVDGATAAVERAKAALLRADLAMKKLEIKAGFAGVIEETYVEPGAFVNPGAAIALLLDKEPIEVVGLAGERQIGSIKLGMVGHVALATGTEFDAKVSYISTVAEGDTRTFRVELTALLDQAETRALNLPEGVSADVHIPTPPRQAHFVPTNALTLGSGDQIGVKAVDSDNKVVFQPARIMHATATGLWLDDLPETLTLIVQGQELVASGDQVVAKPIDATELLRLGL
jgi:multidrug efflux system membrane fusion protein